MDVRVAVGMYSMMITVVVFFGGIVLFLLGRFLDEVGFLEVWMSRTRVDGSAVAKFRKALGWGYRVTLVMVVGDLVVFVGLLSLVGSDGWEGLVWLGWCLFVVVMVALGGNGVMVLRYMRDIEVLNRRFDLIVKTWGRFG